MSLLPMKKGINFSGIELFEVLLKVDFDALVEFLNSRGGLNGVEEYGRTALMELTIGRVRPTVESCDSREGGLYAQEGRNELMRAFFRRCRDFSLEYLLRFENEFAQRLVELGCDINQRDRYGFTALRYAVQDKNYEMAEYLLSCPGVEFQDVTPSMDDRMDSILVRGGCDIFLSCCALIYRHYSGDKHFQAEARRAAKRAGELLAMGISLTQPDFTGKTPQDHLREAGLTGLLP